METCHFCKENEADVLVEYVATAFTARGERLLEKAGEAPKLKVCIDCCNKMGTLFEEQELLLSGD